VDHRTAVIRDDDRDDEQNDDEMAGSPEKIEAGGKEEEVLIGPRSDTAHHEKDSKEKNDKEKTREQHDGFVPAFLCFTDSKSWPKFPLSGTF
jgi:hypothetical protein